MEDFRAGRESSSSALVRLSAKGWIDIPSAAVVALMIVGLAFVIALHHGGVLGNFLALALGTFLMNLSFTAWHEPAHQNFSRSLAMNHVVGWLASLASVYPGYFIRRREHLVHHRYQSDPKLDPVHPRIQSGFWGFPARLFLATVRKESAWQTAPFLPLSCAQRNGDRCSNALACLFVAVSIVCGFFPSVLWGWLLPRALVFWLHAYSICYFPHAVKQGGYQLYRVRPGKPLLAFFTVGQSLHGVHHAWPSIPWHRYYRALREMPGQEMDVR